MLALAWHVLAAHIRAIPVDQTVLESMTFLEPVRSASVFAQQARLYLPALEQTGKWWIPLALLLWTAAATLGRAATLRRVTTLWQSDLSRPEQSQSGPSSRPQRSGVERSAVPPAGVEGRSLQPSLPKIAPYTLFRSLAFLVLLTLWLLALRAAVHATVTTPAQHGAEPNIVLLTAEAVGLTLAAFMVWSLTIWALDVQPLKALTGARPSTPHQRKELRSKLIETNLVMGIVRVALFVLAMTFSASPLPFQSQETQAYINVWWIGVALFYILASDFFHVIRRVTYLRLLQSIAAQP